MNNRSKLLSILIITLFFASPCYAVKQYRCNGKIQYRPCGQPSVVKGKPALSLQNAQTNLVQASSRQQELMQDDSDLYAEILKPTFKKYNLKGGRSKKTKDGQWRGFVKGNGDIHLNLQILRNGAPESTRYMGHVVLRNDQTTFNFVSALPDESDWSWKILANASTVR